MAGSITKHLLPVFLAGIIAAGIYVRFYNLQWGQPFYFHPDERQNVVYPILDSKSPLLLDQQNFDVGPLPLIAIKSIVSLKTFFSPKNTYSDKFEITLLTGRFISANISALISILIALIAMRLYGKKQALISFFLALFSTGFIQYSHFATAELLEAFFFLVIFYLCIQITKQPTIRAGIFLGIITGLALSTKLLSLTIFPIVIYSFFLFGKKYIHQVFSLKKTIKKIYMPMWSFFIFSCIVFFLTSPQLLINFSKVYESLQYESSVTLGKIHVFYTGGFTDTIPGIFQLLHIYPFLINPLLTLFFIPCFLIVIFKGKRKKNYSYTMLAGFFFILFFSQSFFFTKWTRYYIPTLPFVYLILGIGIAEISEWIEKNISQKKGSIAKKIFIGGTFLICFVFSCAFFINTYFLPHSALIASRWAKHNLPKESRILSETFDLGITPFNDDFKNIVLFDFYALDTDEEKTYQLDYLIRKTDIIILPGQRLSRSRIDNPGTFPNGFEFYNKLLLEKTQFRKIYQTPCGIICKIAYMGSPRNLEETVSIFDRPTVTIYKKIP